VHRLTSVVLAAVLALSWTPAGAAPRAGAGDRPGAHAAAGDLAPRFADVPADHPFAAAIAWAAGAGVVAGYPDGTFAPTAPLTRQALAAVLHRMAGSPAVA